MNRLWISTFTFPLLFALGCQSDSTQLAEQTNAEEQTQVAVEEAQPTPQASTQILTGQKPDYKILIEAPLPEGFPQPGPAYIVQTKNYPVYRAAFAEGSGAFWVLFEHIQRHDIPMTTPVEMTLDENGRELDMAFMYESANVGQTGEDRQAQVRDLPQMQVVSYGFFGNPNARAIDNAQLAIGAYLNDPANAHLTATGNYRLMGYNSPMVPREERYYEVQMVLE